MTTDEGSGGGGKWLAPTPDHINTHKTTSGVGGCGKLALTPKHIDMHTTITFIVEGSTGVGGWLSPTPGHMGNVTLF